MTISLFGPSCKFGMCYNVIGPFYRPLQNFQYQHPSCSERGWPQGPEILETALCVLSNPACACVLCKSQKNISALHVHVPSTCNLNICETTWRHSVCVCVCVCVCQSTLNRCSRHHVTVFLESSWKCFFCVYGDIVVIRRLPGLSVSAAQWRTDQHHVRVAHAVLLVLRVSGLNPCFIVRGSDRSANLSRPTHWRVSGVSPCVSRH